MAAREQRPVRLEEYDDVANQGHFLLNNFVYERMQIHHIENAPDLEQLQGPDALRGPALEHVREIGRALRFFGDDLDRDQAFLDLVSRVQPEAEEQTLLSVASSIFEDGIFNWGRVLTLFYFAYKVCVKAVNSIGLMRNIISIIVGFMRRYIVQWIVDHGGWEGIVQHLNHSKRQLGYFVIGGLVACAGVFFYHRYLK